MTGRRATKGKYGPGSIIGRIAVWLDQVGPRTSREVKDRFPRSAPHVIEQILTHHFWSIGTTGPRKVKVWFTRSGGP